MANVESRVLAIVEPTLTPSDIVDVVLYGTETVKPWLAWASEGRAASAYRKYFIVLTSSSRAILVACEPGTGRIDPVGVDWDRAFSDVTVKKFRSLLGWVMVLVEAKGGRVDVLSGGVFTAKKAREVARTLGWDG